jgi:hypothetical protein
MRRWSVLAAIFANETTIAFVAIIFAVTQAPIFQNVGATGSPSVERKLVSAFYVSVFMASLCYFLGHILFSLKCPVIIKAFPNRDKYIDQINPLQNGNTDSDAVLARSKLASTWAAADRDVKQILLPLMSVFCFAAFLVFSYSLAIAALIEFAFR